MFTTRARLTAASVSLMIPLTLLATGAATAGPLASAAAPGPDTTSSSSTAVSSIPARSPAPGVVSISTGPSRWRGTSLRHPNGRRFYPRVERWANLVLGVMHEHGIKRKFLKGILAQLQQESGGNPNSVNRWDINAQRGYPSKGLMQVIAPTYRSNAKPGYKKLKFQIVPYTNVWAALQYVKRNYGMGKFKHWNHGHNQAY